MALVLVSLGLSLSALAQTLYAPFAFTTMRDLGTSGVPLFVLSPYGLCVDNNTNIYIACYNDYTIRKISTTNGTNWSITIFAGAPNAYGTNDGVGTAARFQYPDAVVADSQGNIFVSDQQAYTIRKITPAGVVTTFAGLGNVHGFADGSGSAARFYGLAGMGIDAADNIYASDYGNNKLRKITSGGAVSTIVSGPPTVAEWAGGICADTNGNLYHACSTLHTIRKITPGGGVTTIAGTAGSPGSADGTNSAARFNGPGGIVMDRAGNLYVCDGGNSTIRKMTPVGSDWVVKTAAGVPGVTGTADGSGSTARFKNPIGLAIDANGRLYVSDTPNALIRTGSYDGPTNDFNAWTNSSYGKWENPTNNWSTGYSPSIKDAMNLITNAGSKAVLIDATTVSTSPNSLKINNLLVTAPDGSINGLALYNSGTVVPLQLTENLVVDSGGAVAITNGAIRAGIGVTIGYKNGGGTLNVLSGGRVVSPVGYVGLDDDGGNAVQISGAGSMWTNQSAFVVGYYSYGNGLLIDNGGNVSDQWGVLGQGADGNLAAVNGLGSIWRNTGTLVIGEDGGNGNSLTVANGGVVQVIGEMKIGTGGDSNVVAVANSGTLTTGQLRLNSGGQTIYNALYIGTGATVSTTSLTVSNGNFVGLAAGTLNTSSTMVNNGVVFPVGVGEESATLRLNGGTHTFVNGLQVTDHGVLTGCGTIVGPVTVDVGGTIVPDQGCAITFASLTNNGTVQTGTGTNIVVSGFFMNRGSLLTNYIPAPACPIVVTGAIVNLQDSPPSPYVITDGTNSVQFNWSVASPGNSGYVYTTANTAVAAVTNVTSISQITNAAAYTFTNSNFVGPMKDTAFNGGVPQFVLLKHKTTGHYVAVRFDDITTGSPNRLNASWWFLSQAGSTNLGCVPPPPPPGPLPATNFTMQSSSGNLGLSFATQVGRAYTVQMRTNLTVGPWVSVTNFPGDGFPHAISIIATNPRAYYRVLTQ